MQNQNAGEDYSNIAEIIQ